MSLKPCKIWHSSVHCSIRNNNNYMLQRSLLLIKIIILYCNIRFLLSFGVKSKTWQELSILYSKICPICKYQNCENFHCSLTVFVITKIDKQLRHKSPKYNPSTLVKNSRPLENKWEKFSFGNHSESLRSSQEL